MKTYRILVTGGAGFIGSHLIRYLLTEAERELGITIDRVLNLDKLTYAADPDSLGDVSSDSRYRLVVGDICDHALVSRTLAEEAIDSVIHLAAESHVDRSIDSSAPFVLTNVMGTHVLLESARGCWEADGRPESFRFLHVSTDEVYGSLQEGEAPRAEGTMYAPGNPYSASKAAGDHLVRAWHRTYGFPAIVTHCSNNYGPFQFPEKLIPLTISKLRGGLPLPVYGDGSNIRDWLFVRDHCRGLALALLRGQPGETYHFGGACEKTNLEVVEALAELFHERQGDRDAPDPRGLIQFVPDRPGHDRRYVLDTTKARTELGWSPGVDFRTGLEATLRWYLENGSWLARIESGAYRGERLGLTGRE